MLWRTVQGVVEAEVAANYHEAITRCYEENIAVGYRDRPFSHRILIPTSLQSGVKSHQSCSAIPIRSHPLRDKYMERLNK
jgi:hypothetical protein